MQTILANYTASITELKKSPTKLLEEVGNEPIAILNHNSPSAYLVPSAYFEKLMDMVDDYHLAQEVEERLDYKEDELIEVDIDELV
ncbi:MAG: type II toxin-antitoxin system prevent-host-death family antitoxin [Campylobacterota bacterium]|nr:type II toxin-antitoxin system prevent-host-death family antitoxin [Campylobacterota bacterium]